jgi:hypothetical protein
MTDLLSPTPFVLGRTLACYGPPYFSPCVSEARTDRLAGRRTDSQSQVSSVLVTTCTFLTWTGHTVHLLLFLLHAIHQRFAGRLLTPRSRIGDWTCCTQQGPIGCSLGQAVTAVYTPRRQLALELCQRWLWGGRARCRKRVCESVSRYLLVQRTVNQKQPNENPRPISGLTSGQSLRSVAGPREVWGDIAVINLKRRE